MKLEYLLIGAAVLLVMYKHGKRVSAQAAALKESQVTPYKDFDEYASDPLSGLYGPLLQENGLPVVDSSEPGSNDPGYVDLGLLGVPPIDLYEGGPVVPQTSDPVYAIDDFAGFGSGHGFAF